MLDLCIQIKCRIVLYYLCDEHFVVLHTISLSSGKNNNEVETYTWFNVDQ